MKIPFLLFLSITFLTGFAQIGVGQWQDHLPYQSVNDLIEKDDFIIGASSSALFKIDKATKEVTRFSVLNGLSEVDISSIAYYKAKRIIIVGYNSGNIDLILDDEIINLPELKNTNNIKGGKTINDIYIHESIALLSCNFGIIKLDLNKLEINDTYKIGFDNSNKEILCSTVFKDTIYSATTDGIYKAYINNPLLSFSNSWSQLNLQGLIPDSSNINTLASTTDYLMFNNRGAVHNTEKQFILKNNIISESPSSIIYRVNRLKAINNEIFMTGRTYARHYKSDINYSHFVNNVDYNFTASIRANDFSYWCSDKNNGLVKVSSSELTPYYPSGPFSLNVSQINNSGDKLYMAHGGRFVGFGRKYSNENFSILENNKWTHHKVNSDIETRDIMTILPDPFDENKQWGASWGYGIVEYENYQAKTIYNNTNSSIEPRAFNDQEFLMSDIKFDSKGTLWALSSQSPTVLSSKDQEDNWKSYSFGSLLPTSIHTTSLKIFNDLNQKWVFTRGQGIIVLDESQNGNTIKKLSTNTGQGALPSLNVLSAAIDNNRKIWIGTDEGLAVMSSPRNIFKGGNFDANHVLVFFDGNWEPVLKGQYIQDIEIDGGNRKWFATKQGAFLTSEDGTEQIHHFTSENSPLLSNDILDISIHHKTGEVFFATDKGLVSFKSDAQKVDDADRSVMAYPNPVEPNYEGLITIDGLISNSTVKIVDVSGRIVYQTKSEGNRATWDGRSLQGELASSGVYLVYSADQEGVETEVAKLSIVR